MGYMKEMVKLNQDKNLAEKKIQCQGHLGKWTSANNNNNDTEQNIAELTCTVNIYVR